jgi:hypothetical protein
METTYDESEIPSPASQEEDTSEDKGDGIGQSSGHSKQCQLLGLFRRVWVHLNCMISSASQAQRILGDIPIILIADGMVNTASKAEIARKT